MDGFWNDRTSWEREWRKLRQMASELDAHALRFSQRVENLAPEELPPELQAEYNRLRSLADQLNRQIELVEKLRRY